MPAERWLRVMITYSPKSEEELTEAENKWRFRLWDKQDRVYFGDKHVDQFGSHLSYKKYFFCA